MSMDQITQYKKNTQTREEQLEHEVRWLDECLNRIMIENLNLRKQVEELEKLLKETK